MRQLEDEMFFGFLDDGLTDNDSENLAGGWTPT